MSIEWNADDRVANNVPPDKEPTLAMQTLNEMEVLSVDVGNFITAEVQQSEECSEENSSESMENKNESDNEPVEQQEDAPCWNLVELQETKECDDSVYLDDNNNDEAKDKTDCIETVPNDTVIKIECVPEDENAKEAEVEEDKKQQDDEDSVTSVENSTETNVVDVQSTDVSSSMHAKLVDNNEKVDGCDNKSSAMDARVQRKDQEFYKRPTYPVNYRASTSRGTYSTNRNFNYIENKHKPVLNTADERSRNCLPQRHEPRVFSGKPFLRMDDPKSYRRNQNDFSEETLRPFNNRNPNMYGHSWGSQKRNAPRESFDEASVTNSNDDQNYPGKVKKENTVYRRTMKYNDNNYAKTNSRTVERPFPPKRNYGRNYSSFPNSEPVLKNESLVNNFDDKPGSVIAYQDTKLAEIPVYSDPHFDPGNKSVKLISNPIDENYRDKSQEMINNDPITTSMNSLQITDTKPSTDFNIQNTNNNGVSVKMEQAPQPAMSQASNVYIDYNNRTPGNNALEYVNVASNYATQPEENMQVINVMYTPPLVNLHQNMKESSESMVPNVSQNISQSAIKPPGFYNHSIPRNRWNYTQDVIYPGTTIFPNYNTPPPLFYMPYACGPNWNPHLAYHPSMVQHPQLNAYAHRNDSMNKSRNPAHVQNVSNYHRQPETKHPNYGYHMAYDTFGCDYKPEYNNPRTVFPTKPEQYYRTMPLNESQKYFHYPYATAIDTNFMNQSIYNQTAVCDYKQVAEAQCHATSSDIDFNKNKSANNDERSIPPLVSPKDCMNYENFVPNSQARLNSSYSYRNPADRQMPQTGMGRGRLRVTNQ